MFLMCDKFFVYKVFINHAALFFKNKENVISNYVCFSEKSENNIIKRK